MMSEINKRLENDELIGCIQYKNEYNFYLMPIAYWILNYQTYDPTYDPSKWQYVFRNNVLNVLDDVIDKFIESIETEKLSLEEVTKILPDVRSKRIFFFIDFDEKKFISSFSDIEVEEYLPNDKWQGRYDDPIKYLPSALKQIFR